MKHNIFACSVFLILTLVGLSSFAGNPSETFPEWLTGFKNHASTKGISQNTIDSALMGIEPIQRVIELDGKQPEGTMTFTKYRRNIVNTVRIKKGREMMKRYASELAYAENKFGVGRQYIVALWGIETNYGSNTGGFNIVPALATLAWDGRRRDFFTKELVDALRILDEGHITLSEFKGSWAGALGQNQFMPSSFHSFAIDGSGDGKKDIWNNKKDVFSSTANYLSKSGWHEGERWGREIKLPANFSKDLIGLKVKKSLPQWQKIGVRLPSGGALPQVADMDASIVAPDGIGGQTFIVYNNYRTIMKWNRSTYFATSVGLLANAIAQ